MEAELKTLEHSERDDASPEERQANSLWKIIAMKQSEEREKAEAQNKALKSLLSAQHIDHVAVWRTQRVH
ncbi:uncharacterized protein IUM83_19335 [Phytophthora cinnamomi]|uniref:uncharacterized protein n=1 Tax=Phytophthora cinnamomi TaxID=4785 RepID=UPI003559E968|nr:hypothetical protein IUM83_19335 [Phytophthora cinnamomi]